MKHPLRPLLVWFAGVALLLPIMAQNPAPTAGRKAASRELTRLENPITAAYLQEHLSKNSPRLILTPAIEAEVRVKLRSDPLVQRYYRYLQTEAAELLKQPPAQHILVGFRMPVAFSMMKTLGILSMVYRLDPRPELLARINTELLTVCDFPDWNPPHFLDVSQMSSGVALALDWTGEALPAETVRRAKAALIEKGIRPSFNTSGVRMQWIGGNNNWNSVCHGGMVVAALAIADVDPELAAKTISRALEMLPHSLKEYAPDGAHPEGPSYWRFGTSFSVLATNVLQTALGSDFGLAASPGFLESANFRLQATAPSGDCFNFADSDTRPDGESSVLLAWFAAQTGDSLYLDRPFFAQPTRAERLAGPGLVWLSQFTEKKKSVLPLAWRGRGANPVAVFRGAKSDTGQLYLAAKGGMAQISHGNMDAGTFIFELDGVRWVVDPGNQDYEPLNRIGFPLSDYTQNSQRWGLLTKSNLGHSTVVVNGARFNVTGPAPIVAFQTGEKSEATIDLSAALNGQVSSWQRRFAKESNRSILIQDRFETNALTKEIVWQLITVAAVAPEKNGALLRQEGRELRLAVLTPPGLPVTVVSLDPPPSKLDKTIKNLKRVEIRVPASVFKNGQGLLEVRLAGQ